MTQQHPKSIHAESIEGLTTNQLQELKANSFGALPLSGETVECATGCPLFYLLITMALMTIYAGQAQSDSSTPAHSEAQASDEAPI